MAAGVAALPQSSFTLRNSRIEKRTGEGGDGVVLRGESPRLFPRARVACGRGWDPARRANGRLSKNAAFFPRLAE